MANLEVRELAAKTAAEIRRRGWTQGSWYGKDRFSVGEADCTVCVLGGINAARGRRLSSLDAFHEPLYDVIADRTEADPAEWNDKYGRTAGDVLALLDGIAAGQ